MVARGPYRRVGLFTRSGSVTLEIRIIQFDLSRKFQLNMILTDRYCTAQVLMTYAHPQKCVFNCLIRYNFEERWYAYEKRQATIEELQDNIESFIRPQFRS